MNNFIFKKNTLGGLIIELDSYDFSLPRRTFEMAPMISQITIPEQYALGLFVTDSALNMFKAGLFTIANYDALKAKAEEIGLFGDIESTKVYDYKEIVEAVNTNNMEVINKICARKNGVELANLIAAARDNLNSPISSLSQGAIRKIEDTCGVELTIE